MSDTFRMDNGSRCEHSYHIKFFEFLTSNQLIVNGHYILFMYKLYFTITGTTDIFVKIIRNINYNYNTETNK